MNVIHPISQTQEENEEEENPNMEESRIQLNQEEIEVTNITGINSQEREELNQKAKKLSLRIYK